MSSPFISPVDKMDPSRLQGLFLLGGSGRSCLMFAPLAAVRCKGRSRGHGLSPEGKEVSSSQNRCKYF